MNRSALALAIFLCGSAPAPALVGDASPAEWTIARPTVMVIRFDGLCSGVVVAQDLVLTAAHCVVATSGLKIVGHLAAVPYHLADVTEVALHPQFSWPKSSWPAADLALLKLSEALPTGFAPAFLEKRSVVLGDRLIVVGYGVGTQGDANTAGRPRMATFVVTNTSDNLLMLRDAAGGALSVCGGDSGAPAFIIRGGVPALAGVASGGICANYSLVTPFSPYREWIWGTARRLGSPLDP
jgi:Trypsin